MKQAPNQTRKLAIAGGIALAAVLIAACLIWMNRPAARLKAPADELLDRLVSARPDQRDDLIIELGNRGAQVIPQVAAAYEKAANDANLRVQLATIIYRTRAQAEAIPALERLLEKEKDTGVRSTLESFVNGLRRFQGATP